MQREELIKKVQAYFEEMRGTNQLEKHEPDEIDNWDIYSGIRNNGPHREKIATVHGKFKYAVAHAVQRYEFYGYEHPAGKTIRKDGLVRRCDILSLLGDDNIPNALIKEYERVVGYD